MQRDKTRQAWSLLLEVLVLMARAARFSRRRGVVGLTRYLWLLTPGLHLKRWLGLGGAGVFLMAVGLAYLLAGSLNIPLTHLWSPYLTGFALMAGGAAMVLTAVWRLYLSLLPALQQRNGDRGLAEAIYERHYRERGPRIVAIGGGTGLSTLLRGLKLHTQNITAIVTVADDGGSSGRLRRELGVLPPGDFRNCLVALADSEPLMTQLFQYRFSGGSGLEGHSFGNLFIVALSGVIGNFEQAIDESSRILAVRGRIVPSTLTSVILRARMEDEEEVWGESNITGSGNRIRQLSISPPDAEAYTPAVEAIHDADLIILGPGSLYTSVLPNLLVAGIQDALRETQAPVVYVCNVATQPGETDGYSAGDHVRALQRHIGPGIVQHVVVNADVNARLPQEWPNKVVALAGLPDDVSVLFADVVNREYRLRHDPERLAAVLLGIMSSGKGQIRAFAGKETA